MCKLPHVRGGPVSHTCKIPSRPPSILRLGASCILRLRRLLPPTFTPIVKRGSLQLLVPGLILVSPCLQFTSRDLLKTSSLTLTVASQASLDHEDQEALHGAKSPATVPRMKEGFSQAAPPTSDAARLGASSVPCGV